MLLMKSGKRRHRRNKTDWPGKYQNALRKRKLPVLGNIGSGYCQTRRQEINNQERVYQKSKKLTSAVVNLIKGIKTFAVSYARFSGPFLK